MSLLFDMPPDESVRKKRPLARVPVAPEEPIEGQSKREFWEPPPAIKALGRIDDCYECADSTCGAFAHDILHEDGRSWLIQCCFCNTAQWVPVIQGHLSPRDKEFRFRDGRFAGLTIDEVVALPGGLECIVFASRGDKRPAVKAACETWLAKNRSER
jgi:hypothetical protein